MAKRIFSVGRATVVKLHFTNSKLTKKHFTTERFIREVLYQILKSIGVQVFPPNAQA